MKVKFENAHCRAGVSGSPWWSGGRVARTDCERNAELVLCKRKRAVDSSQLCVAVVGQALALLLSLQLFGSCYRRKSAQCRSPTYMELTGLKTRKMLGYVRCVGMQNRTVYSNTCVREK